LENTGETIQAFLKEKADAHWKETEQPYLLSFAGPDMKARAIDYRMILGEEPLKSFVRRTEKSGGYRLVEHPTQKAKVGIVPADIQFEFPGTLQPPRVVDRGSFSERERVVIAFLKALSKLPDEELKNVTIPVSVFAKLLGGR
jgi:hypothetical protein